MRRSIGAVFLVLTLLAATPAGFPGAQAASARNPDYAAYSDQDLTTLVMLVMMDDVERNQRDLKDVMEALAARNSERAKLIEAMGSRYFVEQGLAHFSPQIGRNAIVRDLFETLLVVILDPEQSSDALLKMAAGAGKKQRDMEQAAALAEEWARKARAEARGIEGAQDRLARLASSTSDAIHRMKEAAAAAGGSQYDEEDVATLLMLMLMEGVRDNGDNVRDLMRQLAALNRERAKQIEEQGRSHFVDEALERYQRLIDGNDAVRDLVAMLLLGTLEPSSSGKSKLEAAMSTASVADFGTASAIIEDWIARVHASLVGIDDGKAQLTKLVSNGRRILSLAEGLLSDRRSVNVAAGSLSGVGSAASGAGGSSSGGGVGITGFTDYNVGGGSAGYDTVYGP